MPSTLTATLSSADIIVLPRLERMANGVRGPKMCHNDVNLFIADNRVNTLEPTCGLRVASVHLHVSSNSSLPDGCLRPR